MSTPPAALRWRDGPEAHFEIEAGTCAAIVEASRDHLRKLTASLATLSQTHSFEVEFFGKDVSDQLSDARSLATYCSFDAGLYDELTVEQYLVFFASLWQKESEAIAAALEVCSLMPLRQRTLRALTSSERSFVHLARSLLADPALFLLDGIHETGLDTSELFWQLLAELTECGKTCVICVPRLPPESTAVSQTVVFDHGELLFSGSTNLLGDLLRNDRNQNAGVEVRTSATTAELNAALEPLSFSVSPVAQGAVVTATEACLEAEGLVVRVSKALVEAGLPFSGLLPTTEGSLRERLRKAVGSTDD